jgi:hypothetical protein
LARFLFVNGLRVLAIFSPELGDLSFVNEGEEAFGEADFQQVADKVRGGLNHISASVTEVSACNDNVLVVKVREGGVDATALLRRHVSSTWWGRPWLCHPDLSPPRVMVRRSS